MDRKDCPSDSSLTLSITSRSALGKPALLSICVMSAHRLPIPPGNLCNPLASKLSSSADQLADFAAWAASFASFAFCSPRRLASSLCLACSSISVAFFLRHFSNSSRSNEMVFLGSAASRREHISSNCSFSSAKPKSCSSSISTAVSPFLWLVANFFNLCRNVLATCFCCCRCSFSIRSFSSFSALRCSSCLCFSSSSLRLSSSSSCFCFSFLSFSSLFFASFSSFSARTLGSSFSAVSTSFMMRLRSAS
mmetsp:Transcript_57661/g.137157  ORF Transcript_57661/g.137157 Transcript_57661/m.137157 type:complete len:250 (+) Transcript_57661:647-1396(+)